MDLYGHDISGNTYKIKLLMSLLGLEYNFISLDVVNKQHKSEAYLKLNPRGEFPLLVDGESVIWDSQAILIYLVMQYQQKEAEHKWYATSAIEVAQITQWLTVANNEIFNSLAKARVIVKLGFDGDLAENQKKGQQVLQWLNQHLEDNDWLANNKKSIADIACYPYVALSEEGNIDLEPYENIHKWFNRITSLKGYTVMTGLYQK